ncbi:YhcH/YjgK/YiaL family protein [Mucilaginibacter gracilis]|uniref:YhcH/YjgK/YiaL family protein n=1 Tax=Mucilaginibacter gracilis TaxID=423350 RepID=A0A495IW86_9SPHI|nr:YhcH/YjgK/YiaL family protein [Mucilaginibacter gracilis]RKR80930.1 YhcH/YjgK/YiaL family protein [Mucilaginibacter gracilis]
MIIDKLAEADKYYSLHKNYQVAFEYLKAQDLLNMEVGKYEVADGVLAIVSDKPGVTTDVAYGKFECHNKNIDIQLCIRGNETIAWKPRADCVDPRGEYSDEKDVLFYNDAPDMSFQLKGGQFAIFYPEDVHAPMIGDDLIKKLVVKVRIA